jgi:hypothetical protein
MSVTPAGQTPPQAIDRITTQPLFTSDDRVPDVATSGDGYSAPAITEAVDPGSINQALQHGNTNLANQQKPQPQQTSQQQQQHTQQPLDVIGKQINQGEAVGATNNQGAATSVVPGEQKPVMNNVANTVTNGNGTTLHNGIPTPALGAFNNAGANDFTSTWLAAASLAQSSMSQNFSSAFASSLATLYLSQPDTLRDAFSHAVRRSSGHDNHHPTQQQQPSQLVANVFHQLNQQNRLAFISSPANTRGGAGPTALLNEVDRTAFTQMVAASMRDYSARAASGAINNLQDQSLHPQSILAAYGLMHADQLGPDWLAHGITQLIALAQGAGPQEADIILEALALALILSALPMLGAPNGGRSELALAQTFAAMQLIGQMQDPDAFAQMFSRLSPAERTQLLTILATLSPNAKLAGLDKIDPLALLFKAFAARSGDAQRAAGAADTNGTLGTLLGALSARGAIGARTDTLATEKLRAELLHFAATQPASFYYAEAANKKTFHSGRLEAVLQLIVQQLLRELAAKAGRLSRLRCDFADSIELLSNLLDLLTQRDDEDSEHSRSQQHAEEENDSSDNDDAINFFSATPQFVHARNRAQPRVSLMAEYACQTLFRVVPDAKTPGKVAFRWENFGKNAIANLPSQLAPDAVEITELQQLHDYARAAVVAPSAVSASAAEPSYEVLSELLMPSDAAYALGATAAGATIMAKHWQCKMWAHDLTYRLNADGTKAPFDFVAYTHQQKIAGDTDRGESVANVIPPPRTETAMRHDLLRMLENSQDRWVREQASQALAAGLQKLKNNGQTTVESKGEIVRSLRSPMMRDATIYFLSRYYFKLNAQTSDSATIHVG